MTTDMPNTSALGADHPDGCPHRSMVDIPDERSASPADACTPASDVAGLTREAQTAMHDDQPTQALTDADLSAMQTRFGSAHEDMRSYSAETLRLQDTARDVPRLLAELRRTRAERDKILIDLQWYITDLGPEHYQNCDADEGDCYLCDGHVAIRDEWGSAKPIGESS